MNQLMTDCLNQKVLCSSSTYDLSCISVFMVKYLEAILACHDVNSTNIYCMCQWMQKTPLIDM